MGDVMKLRKKLNIDDEESFNENVLYGDAVNFTINRFYCSFRTLTLTWLLYRNLSTWIDLSYSLL